MARQTALQRAITYSNESVIKHMQVLSDTPVESTLPDNYNPQGMHQQCDSGNLKPALL